MQCLTLLVQQLKLTQQLVHDTEAEFLVTGTILGERWPNRQLFLLEIMSPELENCR